MKTLITIILLSASSIAIADYYQQQNAREQQYNEMQNEQIRAQQNEQQLQLVRIQQQQQYQQYQQYQNQQNYNQNQQQNQSAQNIRNSIFTLPDQ
jgi:hypothetical protein